MFRRLWVLTAQVKNTNVVSEVANVNVSVKYAPVTTFVIPDALAAKLNEASVTIAAKASEAGKVFGSVTSMQIAEELEKQGISIDKRTIALKEAIKELGTVKVAVKLHREVSAEITVNVVAE